MGLVSPPGSGNTWVRDLLQRATGICTGIFFNLFNAPVYPWQSHSMNSSVSYSCIKEGRENGGCVVVKTIPNH